MACATELQRWMEHRRPDGDKVRTTRLRVWPRDDSPFLPCQEASVIEGEVVEVLELRVESGYVEVRMMLPRAFGWIQRGYLRRCPEGTGDHSRLTAHPSALQQADEVEASRFKLVRLLVWQRSSGRLRLERCEFVSGHYLGTTGMVHGPKEHLFHGTSDDAAESIIKTGFDDQYAEDGRFGRGLYFSPDIMTSYGYGRALLLCEVALGAEHQRLTATRGGEYSWEDLLADDKRSVQCRAPDVGQEERVVYHCTQCKPVYRLFVSEVDDPRPRWLCHERPDGDPVRTTRLRPQPDDREIYLEAQALDHEVVERTSEDVSGYTRVMLAVTGIEGWVKSKYLKVSAEGTRAHGKLTSEQRSIGWVQLKPDSLRFREVASLIERTVCSCRKCVEAYAGIEIKASKMWFIHGHLLGETGMKTGPKEVLFHGTDDKSALSIAKIGFDQTRACNGKSFGPGLYFSPQSCKAFSYSRKYLLVCEVALGAEENRLTVTEECPDLNPDVVTGLGKRSVQSHARAPFKHEERVVYRSTQCKPVYLVEMTQESPGHGM